MDLFTDAVLCVLIRESVTPLHTLGQISRLNKHYNSLVQYRIDSARKYREKYEPRLRRALWRRATAFVPANTVLTTRVIRTKEATANAFGMLLCNPRVNDRITFITGIGFLCRTNSAFNFALENAPTQFGWGFRADNFTQITGGAYWTHFNLRDNPFDIGTMDDSRPWVIIGEIYGDNKMTDRDFVAQNIIAVVCNYESVGNNLTHTLFRFRNREDFVRKVNRGVFIRALYHYYWEKRMMSADSAHIDKKIEWFRREMSNL